MAHTEYSFAEKIYNILMDMDYLDYTSTEEEDIQSLIEDLELLQKHGNGALMYALEMLTENF